MRITPTFLFIIFLVSCVSCLKFLAYNPQFAISHVNFIGKISDALVDAGHEVVMLSPVINTMIGTTGTKKARVVELPQCAVARKMQEWMSRPNNALQNVWKNDNLLVLMEEFDTTVEGWITQCNATLNHPGLIERLKAEKFDAAYGEGLDLCGFGIFHLLGITRYAVTQSYSHIDDYFITHVPSAISYVPTLMSTYSDQMSPLQRAGNLFYLAISEYYSRKKSPRAQKPFDHLVPGFPRLEDLASNASLVFRNSEPLVDFPTLTAHRIIDIGGIVVPSGAGNLSTKWSDILNLRPLTVLVSSGTFAMAHLMPFAYKETMRRTFAMFPDVTFIWKYEKPEHRVSVNISNIIETTWMPQIELLRDPRLSLFITHCGQGSRMEAITAGVPLLAIPVTADQIRNAQQVVRSGVGLFLEKTQLATEGPLEKAIEKMLNDPKYRDNARRLSRTIAERPIPVRELFVRHMEFLARHGPLRQLDHHGRQLNLIQYYLIDIAIFVIVLLFILSILVIATLQYTINLLRKAVAIRKKKVE